MLVSDIPVQTGQEAGVRFIAGEVGDRTRIVVILLHQVVLDTLHVGNSGARYVAAGFLSVGACAVGSHFAGMCLMLEIDEEEEFVPDDRAAEGETIDGAAVVGLDAEFLAVDAVAAEVLVSMVDVGRTLEVVRTGFCDGVDTAADEVGLTDVEGRHHNLHLVNCIERDRIAAAGKAGGESEVVVEVRAVDGEVGAAAVGTGEAHAVGIRRQLDDVGDRTVHGRHGRNHGA